MIFFGLNRAGPVWVRDGVCAFIGFINRVMIGKSIYLRQNGVFYPRLSALP